MKLILLNIDEAFFYKLKADKLAKEKKLGVSWTWEQYIHYIFGLSKYIKL